MGILFGNKKVKDIYFGSHKIKKVYYGSKLVFSDEEIVELKYIESTGTQWIDTLIPNSSDLEISTKQLAKGGGTNWMYGSRQAYGEKEFACVFQSSRYYRYDIGLINTKVETTDIVESTHTNGKLIVNGIDYTISKVRDFSDTRTLMLFGLRDGSNITKSTGARFYYFNVRRNGEYIMKLVPAMKLSSGEVGMYDKVSGKFFSNKGTGNFVAGYFSDDAAREILRGDWRMPTKEEFEELKSNTTRTWETIGTTIGYRLTAPNGNSIFLPANGMPNGDAIKWRNIYGYYWASDTPYMSQSASYYFDLYSSGFNSNILTERYRGMGVRAVSMTQGVDLGLPSGLKWASSNLTQNGFAENETDYGDFFSWGETEPKTEYTEATYKFGNPPTKYNAEDNINTLQNEYYKKI